MPFLAPLLALTTLATAPPRGEAATRSSGTLAPAGQERNLNDPRAAALLHRVELRLKTLRSVDSEWELSRSWHATPTRAAILHREIVSVHLARPALWRVSARTTFLPDDEKSLQGTSLYGSDGHTLTWIRADHVYTRSPPTTASGLLTGVAPLRGFFATASSPETLLANRRRMGDRTTLQYLGKQQWQGASYEVVRAHIIPDGPEAANHLEKTLDICVGSDSLIHRWIEAPPPSDTVYETTEWTLRRITVDKPLRPAEFTLTLPADAKPYQPPTNQVLLANGVSAPDFVGTDRDGRTVRLSDYRGKVVVLDFWATWCGPCIASMPHTADVAKRTADLGAVVLAVNSSDDQPTFDTWVKAHPELSALTFVRTTKDAPDSPLRQYHITGIPTQYVIDPTGKIVASYVGYNGPTDTLEKTIRKAGEATTASAADSGK